VYIAPIYGRHVADIIFLPCGFFFFYLLSFFSSPNIVFFIYLWQINDDDDEAIKVKCTFLTRISL